MIDPAQERRNAEPADPTTSFFCRLKKSNRQNYIIDKHLEEFHTIEELVQLTSCTVARIKSHIRYIRKNCLHASLEGEHPEGKFRFVLKKRI